MKFTWFEKAINFLVLIICLGLVGFYLNRWPLLWIEPTSLSVPDTKWVMSSNQLGLIGPAALPAPQEVISFVQTVHIHGIPYEPARQFGPEAGPILLDLLADPANELYATNIVVILGFLGQPQARQPLLDYLSQTQGEVSLAQFRGLKSVPFALAQLAHQGDVAALEFLLRASEPDYWNSQTLPWTYNSQTQAAELYQQTLLALGVSGLPQAQTRLAEITSQSNLSAQAENDVLQQALALNQQVQQEGMAPVVSPDPNTPPTEPLPGLLDPQANDTNPNTHRHSFTIARHVNILFSPTDTDIDNFLYEASRIMQTADSAGDISCCVRLWRNGPSTTYAVTDGRITTSAELNQVFAYTTYDVKIVEDLDYCLGYNPSIIGCAYVHSPKNMILEYLGFDTLDGILWAHEFGHNQGLQHPDNLGNFPTRIMNSVLSPSAKQMTLTECTAWHSSGNNPGKVIGPCPLGLTASKMLEATSVVTSGARITYTLTIRNEMFNPYTNITVSDSLSPKISYINGSASASPNIMTFTNFPTSTSPFTLTGGSSVQITYAVQVGSVNSKEVITNTVTINAPALLQPMQAINVAIVDPIKTYLPIIIISD
jgi:uncharacterized repeat protein (TIGR01451 family)